MWVVAPAGYAIPLAGSELLGVPVVLGLLHEAPIAVLLIEPVGDPDPRAHGGGGGKGEKVGERHEELSDRDEQCDRCSHQYPHTPPRSHTPSMAAAVLRANLIIPVAGIYPRSSARRVHAPGSLKIQAPHQGELGSSLEGGLRWRYRCASCPRLAVGRRVIKRSLSLLQRCAARPSHSRFPWSAPRPCHGACHGCRLLVPAWCA